MSLHLNEEEFAACALGDELAADVEPRLQAHLATCAACRAEVASFAASVESFNTASLAWSESQPAPSLQPLLREPEAHPAWSIASWGLAGALAGCLALVSAISVETHRGASHGREGLQDTRLVDDSPAQIERDNKLLLAVAQATSARAASPLQEYGLDAAAAVPARARHAQDEND